MGTVINRARALVAAAAPMPVSSGAVSTGRRILRRCPAGDAEREVAMAHEALLDRRERRRVRRGHVGVAAAVPGVPVVAVRAGVLAVRVGHGVRVGLVTLRPVEYPAYPLLTMEQRQSMGIGLARVVVVLRDGLAEGLA